MYKMIPYRRAHLSPMMPSLFNDPMMREFFNDSSNLPTMNVDVHEEENEYVLEADLPGIKKEDIQIEVDGDTLTIQAQRRNESQEKDEEGRYVRCERSYGGFSRSFDISAIKADQIHAKYENGVLTLELPKKEPAAPTSRRLEIE